MIFYSRPQPNAIPLISILKTTKEELSIRDLVLVGENSTINRVDDNKSSFGSNFHTPEARIIFAGLSQVFIKMSILPLINPKCHVCIKTDISSYVICEVLS